MSHPSRVAVRTLGVIALGFCLWRGDASAQEPGFARPGDPATTPAFNSTTKPFKYLFANGPVWIGQTATAPTCIFFGLTIGNSTTSSQSYLAELYDNSGALIQSSGITAIAANAYSQETRTFGPSGCSSTSMGLLMKVYSTTNALTLTAHILPAGGGFDNAYRSAGGLLIPAGGWSRSVISSSFSFGSSAGVCAATPENSIKVSSANVFPGSPVLGDYGWQSSGSATNTDTCSGNAFADLFLRSSANISGAGKWTFVYQLPNGLYDVTILYNTVGGSTSAGPTVITLNGRTVVNGVTDPPSNLESFDGRVNIGGNSILIGISSPSGTAALNGIIITPVAQ